MVFDELRCIERLPVFAAAPSHTATTGKRSLASFSHVDLNGLAQACLLLLGGIELFSGQQQGFKRGIEFWVIAHIHVFTDAVWIETAQCFFCAVRA